MKKYLSDFKESIQTISFAELANALGCNESTIYRWLNDETIKLPKPIQIGKKKMCFLFEEIKDWLYNRPRFNSFYNANEDKIVVENTQNLEKELDINRLITKQTALKELQKYKHNFLTNKGFVMPCIKIDEVDLFFASNVEKYIVLNEVLPKKDNSSKKKTIYKNVL